MIRKWVLGMTATHEICSFTGNLNSSLESCFLLVNSMARKARDTVDITKLNNNNNGNSECSHSDARITSYNVHSVGM